VKFFVLFHMIISRIKLLLAGITLISAFAVFSAVAVVPVSAVGAAVKPVLECVVDNPDSTYTAYFGYANLNAANVLIPTGVDNKFTPSPENRGQTTDFLPGRQVSVFQVSENDGTNLVWRVKGPDGKARTSTASQGSKPCTV
jgi:hypothetical protein